ncbi:MAG: hypothetical protein JJE05_05665 [Actinobacteria bacterium]|nr:hypothetical protein [Actinomycetota bacterium]
MSDDLRSVLHEAAARPSSKLDREFIEQRAATGRRLRFGSLAAAAAIVLLGTGLVIDRIVGHIGQQRSGMVTTAPPLMALETPQIDKFDLPIEVRDFQEGAGELWAVGYSLDAQSGRMLGIGPSDPSTADVIHLDAAIEDVALTNDSVWVSEVTKSGGVALLQIDKQSHEVLRRFEAVGGPLGASGSYVWGIKQPQSDQIASELARVDVATGDVATFEMDSPVIDFAVDGSTLWGMSPTADGADIGPASLLRIDAVTGTVLDRYEVNAVPSHPLVGVDEIWLRDSRGVIGVAKATGDVTRPDVPGSFAPIAVDPSGLWLLGGDELVHLDSASGQLDRRLAVDLPVGSTLKPTAWSTDAAVWLGLLPHGLARVETTSG